MAFLLNKRDMASSIGISVQAFDKWGIPPVERRGREVFYDVKTVLLIDRERQQENQKSGDEDDALQARLLQARVDLTEEQAVAQRLKNRVSEGRLIDAGFCTFALSRVAMELSSTLDAIPLAMQRQFPELSPRQTEHLKTLVAKGANACAHVDEKLPGWLDDFIRSTDE